MHRVAILTYNQAALFELSCAVELFGLSRPEYESWYDCEVVSFAAGPLEMTAGVQLSATLVDNLDDYSLLILPSWPTQDSTVDTHLARVVKKFHADGKRILSFCSGAFLLAELGILNGRTATTHWRYAELFKARYPQVNYIDDSLYVYDGRLGCSAGSAAGIDLGIEVIRQDYGYKIANQVARRLVISAHRSGGQCQFVETPVVDTPNQFAQALDWALANLTATIGINSFAAQANMSRRTFDRKFSATLNLTPKEWLTAQRLNKAKELLESEPYSIEKIAEQAGFDSVITMRHHFRKLLGVSPKQYRQQFSSTNAELYCPSP